MSCPIEPAKLWSYLKQAFVVERLTSCILSDHTLSVPRTIEAPMDLLTSLASGDMISNCTARCEMLRIGASLYWLGLELLTISSVCIDASGQKRRTSEKLGQWITFLRCSSICTVSYEKSQERLVWRSLDDFSPLVIPPPRSNRTYSHSMAVFYNFTTAHVFYMAY